MLAAVDPRIWNTHFERSTHDCLALATHGDAEGLLVRGWALAAARRVQQAMPDLRAWFEAIARWWIEADATRRNVVLNEFFEALAVASHADAHVLLVGLLDAFPAGWFGDAGLLQLLHTLVFHAALAWPVAPSRSVLCLIERALPSLSTLAHPWLHRQLITHLSLVFDLVSAIDVEPAWLDAGATDDAWRGALTQFFDTVRFRHTMTLPVQEPA